jgi:hypothetical protein
VVSETAELLVNPNPLVAPAPAQGGCQNSTFTLINLSNANVNWTMQVVAASQHFITLDGAGKQQGLLGASGLPNDTQIIKVGCIGVQPGQQYAVDVVYNGNHQLVPISISQG